MRAKKAAQGPLCRGVYGQREGRSRSSFFVRGDLYAKVEPFQPTLAAFMSK